MDEPAPESQETFDAEFLTDGLDVAGIAAKIDEESAGLRKEAGDFVRSLFMQHGYFNGNVRTTLYHEKETAWPDRDRIRIEMVVTCWGLPKRLQ